MYKSLCQTPFYPNWPWYLTSLSWKFYRKRVRGKKGWARSFLKISTNERRYITYARLSLGNMYRKFHKKITPLTPSPSSKISYSGVCLEGGRRLNINECVGKLSTSLDFLSDKFCGQGGKVWRFYVQQTWSIQQQSSIWVWKWYGDSARKKKGTRSDARLNGPSFNGVSQRNFT